MITSGSLFTGIGGLDLGFEQAGMTCEWQCEIDKFACRVLENHWPEMARVNDVRNVTRDTVRRVDVICGGFPCQDVSVAGKRAGLAGERSGLWYEFIRVVDELRPQWVVVENVTGILSSRKGRDFATVLQGLVKCGYGVSWRILDSKYFGVAQKRRRVFVVGSLGNGCSAEVLFEQEGGEGGFKEGGKMWSNTIGRGKEFSGENVIAINYQSGGDVRLQESLNVANTIQANQRQGIVFTSDKSPTLGTRMINPYQAQQSQVNDFCVVTRVGVRKFTPTECERLQGFPDGWTSVVSDTQRYKQLGNAVTVPVARWIASRILEVTMRGKEQENEQ